MLKTIKIIKSAIRVGLAKAKFDDLVNQLITKLPKDIQSQLLPRYIIENNIKVNQQFSYKTKSAKARDNYQYDLVNQLIVNLDSLGKIVGIQPMQGPVGLAYVMRYTQNSTAVNGDVVSRLEVKSFPVEASGKRSIAHEQVGKENAIDTSLKMSNELIDNILAVIDTEASKNEPLELETNDLRITINAYINDIGSHSHRGIGNRLIVSSDIAIQLFPDYDPSTMRSNLEYIGEYEKHFLHIPVFCSNLEEGTILVAYKGGNGETDGGIIFCPYQLANCSGVSIDTVSLEPIKSYFHRFGISVDDEAHKYYRKIKINKK